jgi:hypothetical protein
LDELALGLAVGPALGVLAPAVDIAEFVGTDVLVAAAPEAVADTAGVVRTE